MFAVVDAEFKCNFLTGPFDDEAVKEGPSAVEEEIGEEGKKVDGDGGVVAKEKQEEEEEEG